MKIAVKHLGSVISKSNNINFDYFHIFSESSLNNYDTIKTMNKYFVWAHKRDLFSILTNYELKKNIIYTEDINLEGGGEILIKKIKIPGFGEGIATIQDGFLFSGKNNWLNPSLFNNLVKIKPRNKIFGNSVDVSNNKLCFSLFDPVEHLDFFHLNDFFKIKNKKNIELFNKFITERSEKIKEAPKLSGPNYLSIKVPNGKFKIYDFVSTKTIKYTEIEKGYALGKFIKIS